MPLHAVPLLPPPLPPRQTRPLAAPVSHCGSTHSCRQYTQRAAPRHDFMSSTPHHQKYHTTSSATPRAVPYHRRCHTTGSATPPEVPYHQQCHTTGSATPPAQCHTASSALACRRHQLAASATLLTDLAAADRAEHQRSKAAGAAGAGWMGKRPGRIASASSAAAPNGSSSAAAPQRQLICCSAPTTAHLLQRPNSSSSAAAPQHHRVLRKLSRGIL